MGFAIAPRNPGAKPVPGVHANGIGVSMIGIGAGTSNGRTLMIENTSEFERAGYGSHYTEDLVLTSPPTPTQH